MSGIPRDEVYYNYEGVEWRYDAKTHTATYEGELFDSYHYSYDRYRQYVWIQLSFPGQPYETIHENKAVITAYP